MENNKTHFRILILALTAVVFINMGAATTSHAMPILDQSYDPAPTLGMFINVPEQPIHAQTFTVGVTGMLSNIELNILRYAGHEPSPTTPLIVDVRSTTNLGIPTLPNSGPNILGSVSIAPNSVSLLQNFQAIPPFLNIDLSEFNIPVNTGDILAIVVRLGGDQVGGYLWLGTHPTGPGDYDLGDHYFINYLGNWDSGIRRDYLFRTYVDPAPVPEPSTLLLLGSGLVGILAWQKRRKGMFF